MKSNFLKKLSYFSLLITAVFIMTSCDLSNDEEPPADISDLMAFAKGEAVEFQWTNPDDSDFSYLEIRTSSKELSYFHTTVVSTKATAITIDGLTNNIEYEFDFTTYDTSSNPSSGKRITAIPTGLGNVRNVSCSESEDEVYISWTNPKDTKFAGVEITFINYDAPEDAPVIELNPPSEDQTENQTEEEESVIYETVSEEENNQKQEEETSEYSDEEIIQKLSLNDRTAAEAKKYFSKLTVKTEDQDINSYRLSGLTPGTSYTVKLSAYDSEETLTAPYVFRTKLPEETDGLVYKLSEDCSSYIVTSFKGDESQNHIITPEEENGYVGSPISVVIPKLHNEKPVTAIAQAAFKNCHNITEITIPSSVTRIGKNAFENCISLEGVSVPENVAAIEDGTFWNCLNLKWLVIPESVKKIGLGAILNDTKLTTVFYTGTEKEWKSLEKDIESGNSILRKFSKRLITKPAEIRFEYDGTTPIELIPPSKPEDVLAEPGNCFALLSWKNPSDRDFDGVRIDLLDSTEELLQTYFVPSTQDSYVVTELQNGRTYSFNLTSYDRLRNCSEKVETQKIKPELITNIDNKGFYFNLNKDGISCSVCGSEYSRKVVSVPESIDNYPVTEIGRKAFADDSVLEILILPETVVKIATDAFEGCSQLANLYFNGSSSQLENIEGIEELNASLRTDFIFAEDDTEPPEEVTVDYIRKGESVFGVNLTLPADNDFYKLQFELNGKNIEPVKISDTLYAFTNLKNNESYTVRIMTQDIYGNTSAGISFETETGPVIPEGISKEGFKYTLCENKSVLSGTSYKLISYREKTNHINTRVEFPAFINGIPVTEIASGIFAASSNVESVIIPSTIESIENGAFSHQSIQKLSVNSGNKVYKLNSEGTILYSRNGNQRRLEQVLPCVSGILDFTGTQFTQIAPFAFKDCSKISKVILPMRLKNIADNVFNNCSMLTSVYLPSSVKTVGKNVFAGCSKLSACYYSGTEKQLKKIEFTGDNKKIISMIKYYGTGKK